MYITNPAAQCLRQPVGAGASSLACSSFEPNIKCCEQRVPSRSGGGLAQRRSEIIVECCRSRVTRAHRVGSERWVYDRKIARGERLTGQRTHWQWSRAELGRVESSRVEPSLHKGNKRSSNTIGLGRCCRLRKGTEEITAENAAGQLYENECVSCGKSRPKV